MEISASDAARALQLDERRVRRLASVGDLPARKVGRAWLIESDAVYERARVNHQPGRPLSQSRAWAAIAELAGQRAQWLSSSSRGQVRAVLDRRAKASADQWSALLRNLAEIHDVRLRPAQAEDLLSHAAVRPAELPAAALGLVLMKSVPSVFVSSAEWPALKARLRIGPASSGSARVRVIEVSDDAFGLLADAAVRKAAIVSLAMRSSEPRIRDAAAGWMGAAVESSVRAVSRR